MKKKIIITLSVLLLGVIVFYLNSDSYRHSLQPHENELPPMALVNDTMYYLISDIEDEISSKADGTIKKIVLSEVPSENEQANFGEENMEYWIGDDCLDVKFKENILRLFKMEESPFTDCFFSDVVEIRDSRCGQVSQDQMEPVILFLKGLTFTATDEHLSTTNENGELLYGNDVITFIKSNGTEITFLRNHATMTSLDGAGSYVTESENLNIGLQEAFGQALNYSGE